MTKYKAWQFIAKTAWDLLTLKLQEEAWCTMATYFAVTARSPEYEEVADILRFKNENPTSKI